MMISISGNENNILIPLGILGINMIKYVLGRKYIIILISGKL